MADPIPLQSADSADPTPAVVDGVRLAEVMQASHLSRDTAFKLAARLQISRWHGPGPGGKGRVAWISAADADRLSQALRDVAEGRLRVADVGVDAIAQRHPTQQTLATVPAAPSADSADGAVLLTRLDAADRAMAIGLPLTTAELAWVLGVRPGAAVFTRGGITARRIARNAWQLSPASPDSAAAG